MNLITFIKYIINMHKEKMKIERHERTYGPHFNEEFAEKAVSKMENENGSRGEHWSLELTTQYANQYGINLKGEKFNKYDWYVALNMVHSDYYRAVVNMTNSDHVKYFIELAKAWLNDKDIEEGKMWYYYCYVMCSKMRSGEDDYEDDEEEYAERRYARGSRYARGGRRMHRSSYEDYDNDDDYDYDQHARRAYHTGYNIRMSRY